MIQVTKGVMRCVALTRFNLHKTSMAGSFISNLKYSYKTMLDIFFFLIRNIFLFTSIELYNFSSIIK